MRRVLPILIGLLATAVGLLWTLQGLGYVKGSPMTGVSFWAVVGPILAGFGVALVIIGLRRPKG
ncbi:MAG TPA: hypothetical protein VM093_02295 [Aeromicrobium sp.]|nr:hypothetical protein [Aeromicrobium sp.]